MTTRLRLWTVLVIGLVLAAPVKAGNFELLHYDEATIADIQAAFKAKTLTCRTLVQMYLKTGSHLLEKIRSRPCGSSGSSISRGCGGVGRAGAGLLSLPGSP